MKVSLLAHTQLSDAFYESLETDYWMDSSDGQAIALTAIRTCYSHNKPTEILDKEGEKYFSNRATDSEPGMEVDRLIRHITRSGHTSTLEHITFTFAVEDVSRVLLAQLTRHRVGFSYSVQSQRYVKFGSENKSGGYSYMTPEMSEDAQKVYKDTMDEAQKKYDLLRQMGVSAEDARMVLPNGATCNLVLTANLRSLLDFYSKRQPMRGAQNEITQLAEALKDAVVGVEEWTGVFFDEC